MLKERLQILVGHDQRRRLDAEAKRRNVSVGAVVREAIDAQLGGPDRERRMRAVEEMHRRPKAKLPDDPGGLERMIAEAREESILRGFRRD